MKYPGSEEFYVYPFVRHVKFLYSHKLFYKKFGFFMGGGNFVL